MHSSPSSAPIRKVSGGTVRSTLPRPPSDLYNQTQQQQQQQQIQSQHWDVEVVKGKVSSRCFWNACKALSFGLLLMFIGTTMAILGNYNLFINISL
ncbi:hypothetical protein O3M35_011430 [Rhynocoris fuscipes]|uniref:Uncharacterized protein n=1 Tax=Rhynocoris fuscipes TaxID=488301 RepID=A0AAW1CV44_9HEMI